MPKMLIICNNTKGISSNSTINKLIVIGIFLNNIKMKFRILPSALCMEVLIHHLIEDFVTQNPFIPQSVNLFIELFLKMTGKHFLHFTCILFSTIVRKGSQQVQLSWS